MTWEYKTIQGDTWDVLSFDIYGSEKLAYLLLEANPEYMNMLFLPSGLNLTIPQTPATATAQLLPPWVGR